jgi:lysophospholipase L1-like esterase
MQTWVDGDQGGTPVDAARLTHMEEGIYEAAQTADSALAELEALGTAALHDVSDFAPASEAAARAAADSNLQDQLDALGEDLQTKADLVAGKVPTSQLPAISLFSVVEVADEAARLALPGGESYFARQVDTGAWWVIDSSKDPADPDNWILSDADPTAAVQSVNGQTGNPVLGYADVGADPAGAAAAAQAAAIAAAALDATSKAAAAQAAAIDAAALDAASQADDAQAAAEAYAAQAVASEKDRADALYTPIAPTRIFVAGHSAAAGGGSPSEEQAWHNLLGAMLRAEVVNYSKGGAVASWTESGQLPYGTTGDGGVGAVLSKMPWPSMYRPYRGLWNSGTTYAGRDVVFTGASPYSWWESTADGNTNHDPTAPGTIWWRPLTGVAAHPYTARGQLPIMFFGNNDLGWSGDLNAWLNAMRAILAMATAAEVSARAADARCSYSAGFAGALPTGLGQGAGVASGVTNGARGVQASTSDVETIVTPQDWPGGWVTLTYCVVGKSTAGVFRVNVDGATVLTKNLAVDTVGIAGGAHPSNFGLRFQVPAGAHKIEVQQTTAVAGMSLLFTDGLMLEASPAPPVIVPGLFKFLDSSLYAALYGGGTTASDAKVDEWNAALQAMLAAEFPSAVYHDMPITPDPSLFYSDSIHLNAKGQARIAADLAELITTVVIPSLDDEQRAAMSRLPKTGRVTRLHFGDDNPANAIAVPVASGWTDAVYTAQKTGYTNGTRYIEGSISADPGDIVEISLMGTWNNNASAQGFSDFAVLAFPNGLASPTRGRYVSSGDATQAPNGVNVASINTGIYIPISPATLAYRVRHDDLRLGQVTFRLILRSIGADRTILCSTSNRVQLYLRNVGQEQPYWGALNAR